MLSSYLQQATSADVIFQMHFFLGALRVKAPSTTAAGDKFVKTFLNLGEIRLKISCESSARR